MHLTIAALTLPIVPGQPQVIIPCGTFTAPNGSLKGQGPWTLDDPAGRALVDQANSGLDIVVDYEHQTLMSAQNGQPAPAAGWLLAGGFVWQPDAGVVATDIRWTTEAAEMIQEGEYRFLSPVFSYSTEGVPMALLSVALTNTPALTTLQELTIAATNRGISRMDLQSNDTANVPVAAPVAGSTPTTVATALTQTPPVAALSQPLATTPIATPVTQHPMIAALTNQVTNLGADNARLREELAVLQRQLTDSAKESVITAALSAGKLMPGMEPWARSMDIDDLSNYLAKSKPIAALTGTQTKGVAPKASTTGNGELNNDEIAICKHLNVTAERFLANRVALENRV